MAQRPGQVSRVQRRRPSQNCAAHHPSLPGAARPASLAQQRVLRRPAGPAAATTAPARPPAAAPMSGSCSMAQASTWRMVASSASSHRAAATSPVLVCSPAAACSRHPQRVPGQRGGGPVLLPGLGQQPGPVGAQRLQHHIPGPAIRAGPRRDQQRAVHQPQHHRPGALPGDRLGRLQRERPGNTDTARNTRRSCSSSSW